MIEIEMASQTIVSWNPLAEWLHGVESLRWAGFGTKGAVCWSSGTAAEPDWAG